MLGRFLWRHDRRLKAGNENRPQHGEAVSVSQVRSVATEAALATSLDVSPAVLVNLWSHDERLHPNPPVRSPRRRAS